MHAPRAAIAVTGLYRSQPSAGVVYQAAVRRELNQRLGVDWPTPVNDACEIAGIPRRLVRPFSTRHEEIEIELEHLGASGSKAGDDATLATRESTAAIDAEGIVSR